MTNQRFVYIWAALMPVITGAIVLVQPLGLASWSTIQTGLVITLANAFSATVLAAVAHFWSKTVSEPAVLVGAVTAFLISLFSVGNAFVWWTIDKTLQDYLLAFVSAVVTLGLAFFVRQSVTSPETLIVEHAKAATPEAFAAATNPKLLPPS